MSTTPVGIVKTWLCVPKAIGRPKTLAFLPSRVSASSGSDLRRKSAPSWPSSWSALRLATLVVELTASGGDSGLTWRSRAGPEEGGGGAAGQAGEFVDRVALAEAERVADGGQPNRDRAEEQAREDDQAEAEGRRPADPGDDRADAPKHDPPPREERSRSGLAIRPPAALRASRRVLSRCASRYAVFPWRASVGIRIRATYVLDSRRTPRRRCWWPRSSVVACRGS